MVSPSHRPGEFLPDCVATFLEFVLYRKVINRCSEVIMRSCVAYNKLASDRYPLLERNFRPLPLRIFGDLDGLLDRVLGRVCPHDVRGLIVRSNRRLRLR